MLAKTGWALTLSSLSYSNLPEVGGRRRGGGGGGEGGGESMGGGGRGATCPSIYPYVRLEVGRGRGLFSNSERSKRGMFVVIVVVCCFFLVFYWVTDSDEVNPKQTPGGRRHAC